MRKNKIDGDKNISNAGVIHGDYIANNTIINFEFSFSDIYKNSIMGDEEIKKRFGDIDKDILKLKNNKNTCNPIILLIVIVSLSALFIALFVWLNYKFCFGLSSDSIVYTFIGIVATFIVISNYMQVKEVERKFENSVRQLKEEFENSVGQLKEENEKKTANLKNYMEMISSINTATYYLELKQYPVALGWYFTALSYSSPFYEDQLTILNLILQKMKLHSSTLNKISENVAHRYIDQLKLLKLNSNDIVKEIIDLLNKVDKTKKSRSRKTENIEQ